MWLNLLKHADWEEPAHIIKTFATADLLGNGSNRVVFNIAGNNYRVICKYHIGNRVHLYVKWVGTHAAYTELCATGDQYIVGIY